MSHKHAQDGWDGYPKVSCVEISADVCLRVTSYGSSPVENRPDGYLIAHSFHGFVQAGKWVPA